MKACNSTSARRRALLRLFLLGGLVLTGLACGTRQGEAPTDDGGAVQRSSEAEDDTLVQRLLAARRSVEPTSELSLHVPYLERSQAYRIQQAMLRAEEAEGETLAGWKMGGTRVAGPGASPDPVFGYSLASHVHREEEPFPIGHLVNKEPLVEAEIAVWIGQDLPGPEVSREALIEAVDGVSGAIELISSRLRPAEGADPSTVTTEHAIADNLSHAGVILGRTRVPLDQLDLNAETVRIEVDGEEKARGSAAEMMGAEGDVLDAVLWLANELPRHGLHLRAGDFVITGSMYDNPVLRPGERAEVIFSTLGTIAVELEGAPAATGQPPQ